MSTFKYFCNVVINEGFDKQDVMSRFSDVVNPLECSNRVFQTLLTTDDINNFNQDETIQFIELNRNQVTDD
tara:strand:- start:1 stop:213 length:213 start_codon:yes stop_codon:yes gene_type:complete